jgi:hypothetical protein
MHTQEKGKEDIERNFTPDQLKDLSLIESNGNISNFYFNINKNFIKEGLMKFIIKARNGTL